MKDNLGILTRARNRVDRGWTQGQLDNGQYGRWARVCAIGAIHYEASPHTEEYRRATRSLSHQLPLHYRLLFFMFPSDFKIPIYNDVGWRQKADILRVYDKAIRKAQRKRDRHNEKYADPVGQVIEPTIASADFPVHLMVWPVPVVSVP